MRKFKKNVLGMVVLWLGGVTTGICLILPTSITVEENVAKILACGFCTLVGIIILLKEEKAP